MFENNNGRNQNFNNMNNGFQNNGYGNNNSFDMTNNYEQPPVLDPIKRLSDASPTTAPNLDVLGPMNVMPESLPAQTSSILPAGNSVQNNPSNYDDVIPGMDPELHQAIRTMPPEMNGNYQTTSVSESITPNPFDQEEDMSSQYQVNNTMLSGLNPLNDLSTSTSVSSSETYNFQSQESSGLNINNSLNSENISEINDVSTATGVWQNAQNNFNMPLENNVSFGNTSLQPEVPDTSNLELTTTTLSNETVEYSTESSAKNEENDYNIDNNTVLQEPIKEVPEETSTTEEEPMVEISDIKLSSEEEKDEMNDLSFDSSSDTLEIMDLDNEEQEASSSSDNDAIVKLRKLVEELKYNGYKIETEEFDFEDMLQLIIKINK